MDELNCDTNDKMTSTTNSDEEQSSSFILQPVLNNDQHEENIQYELKAPLLISQIYQEEFFDHFHMNYYGELEHDGLFLASIRSIPIKINNNKDNQLLRAIIRTENNNYDISQIININNEENILQILIEKAELSPIHHYEAIHHIKANEKIVEFDKYNDEQYSNKISIIFQDLNQINENEILSNNQMSIEMENFINLISKRIELKDFNKYRGDLDIKTNQHGIYSYFTIFKNHQIMFNISPIIPTDKNDQQFIQRKSLIANALICIVFQQEETSFHPNFIPGKVTQVYIIVQPIKINSELYYKIEIWRRSDIEIIDNPSGGIFKHEESFRNYFLTLILNTINIILKKDFFHSRIIEQRQHLKHNYIKNICQIFYSYSNNQNSSDQQIFIQNSNRRKQTPIKYRRFSFIPKIKETFTNHRSSLRTSLLHQQEDLDKSTNTIASLMTNSNNFIGLNNQTLSSISTINNNTTNQNEHETNLSSFNNNDEKLNNNQQNQIKMDN